MRDDVISALFRLTALCISSAGTISTTNARRAGLSNAIVTPPMEAIAKICQTCGFPLNASAASANDCAIAIALHDQQQAALVGTIGDEAGPRTENQDRTELGHGQRAQRNAVVGELQDEQRLRDEREPVADLRDQLAREEQAEVADVQRLERLVRDSAQRGSSSDRP